MWVICFSSKNSGSSLDTVHRNCKFYLDCPEEIVLQQSETQVDKTPFIERTLKIKAQTAVETSGTDSNQFFTYIYYFFTV